MQQLRLQACHFVCRFSKHALCLVTRATQLRSEGIASDPATAAGGDRTRRTRTFAVPQHRLLGAQADCRDLRHLIFLFFFMPVFISLERSCLRDSLGGPPTAVPTSTNSPLPYSH